MQHQIDPRKVAGVCTTALQSVGTQGFAYAEIIIGLSEAIGRLIVESSANTIHATELAQIAGKHISDTIRIGVNVKTGQTMEEPRIQLIH
jgi:hypothetical protein